MNLSAFEGTVEASRGEGTHSSSMTRGGLSEYMEDRLSVSSRIISAEEISIIGVLRTL